MSQDFADEFHFPTLEYGPWMLSMKINTVEYHCVDYIQLIPSWILFQEKLLHLEFDM